MQFVYPISLKLNLHETHMTRKYVLIVAAALILVGAPLGYHLLSRGSATPRLSLATAVRQELSTLVSTNGIIEPVDRTDIVAPMDAFVTSLPHAEGSEVTRGQLLASLESQQLMTALAGAKAALLQARSEAQTAVEGPSKEEVAAVEASIAEVALQMNQLRADLIREEALLKKEATTHEAVENMRKQADQVEVRLKGLQQKKAGLFQRYSEEEKQLRQGKVSELSRQVELLDQQVRMGSIFSPVSGILYSRMVNPGSYVNKGQQLAQLYQPGRVRLRAYVDEPDLGRIQKGQRVLIDWDGLPDQRWKGVVDQPAKQVVALGTRFIGYVICTLDNEPKELIPNLNVKVQIVTASKAAALVVPRTAVFSHNGKPAVLWSDGEHTAVKPVLPGLVTPEEIEILQGIDEGTRVVTNPGEIRNP